MIKDKYGDVHVIKFDKNNNFLKENEGKFGMIIHQNDGIYIQRRCNKKIYKINFSDDELKELDITIDLNIKKEIIEKCFLGGIQGNVFFESNDVDILFFLEKLTEKK